MLNQSSTKYGTEIIPCNVSAVYMDLYAKYFGLFQELIKITGNNDFYNSKETIL
jgi:hypothetical protein